MSRTDNTNTLSIEVQRIAALFPNKPLSASLILNTCKPNFRSKFQTLSTVQFQALLAAGSKRSANTCATKPVNSKLRPDIPLSESPRNRFRDATAEDCIKDLRAVAEANPEKVISRNMYRNIGKYPESLFTRHYGTFHEFKRQAGLVLTRQQHHLEKNIAKHASVDQYRQLTAECQGYAEKYLKPAGGRWKTVLGIVDIHDKEADPFVLRVIKDTAKRVQPDVICIGGDLFDLPEFSMHTNDPRNWDVVGRIKFAHKEVLAPLRKAAPNAQIDLIAGNHEMRLLRHMSDATPALRAVLSDLHGLTVSKLLGLDEFEVNFISIGDLAAFTATDIKKELQRNYKVYWNSFLVHHYPEGRRLGMPGFCGHHHAYIAWPHRSVNFGSYNYYQVGAVHRKAATYTNGEHWSNGFMLVHVDTQTQQSIFEYIPVGEFAVVGGKYYFRQPDEV